MNTPQPAAKALKSLRERAGLSIQDVAHALHMPKSTYASKEDKFKKAFLPLDLVEALVPVLEGLGNRPIDRSEILDMAGIYRLLDRPAAAGLHDPRADDRGMDSPGFVIPEVELSDGGATAAPKGNWQLPPDYARFELRLAAGQARIIEMKGDSMSPTLEAGDRLMVDTADRTPSPAGIFAIWDGLGVVVRRLEHIPNSAPPRLKLTSDNTRHPEYERRLDDVGIIGRVVWFGRRL